MKKQIDVYTSERGMFLLAQTPSDKPILTAECYTKWYSLYLLNPDGSVTKVADEILEFSVGGDWVDHEIHPNLIERIAESKGWYTDKVTLEVAAGRWVMSGHPGGNAEDYT